MIPLGRHDLVRSDATIRYWTRGRVDAPTVVLLHGATLDHRAWTPQLDELQRRYRVVLPDLRAHGESSGRFDFEATVRSGTSSLCSTGCPSVAPCSSGSASAERGTRDRAPRARPSARHGGRGHAMQRAERHPMAASATIAALAAHAYFAGDTFAREAARHKDARGDGQAFVNRYGSRCGRRVHP
jgi:hypothetical protein